MPGPLSLDSNYRDNTLDPNYKSVAFVTEDGSNFNNVISFSYAGGSSTYSFGVYQFDVGKNDPQIIAFLTNAGFTTAEINELKQSGGLSQQTKDALSTKLANYLGNPTSQASLDSSNSAGAQALRALNTYWANQKLYPQLQAVLDNLEGSNAVIASQIYQSPELQYRLLDYANQLGLGATGDMERWLSGQAVTMYDGTVLKLTPVRF